VVNVKEKSFWTSGLMMISCLGMAGCYGLTVHNGAPASGGSPVSPAATSSISGKVTPAGTGAGVSVVLGGESSATVVTDSSGSYSFSSLHSGAYTVTPSKSGLSFNPSSRDVTTNGSAVGGANFAAGNPPSSSGPVVISGQNGRVIHGLKITSTSGDCVTIINSSNITIEASEIGPCKGNGIKIRGGSGINVVDNYIHPETQSPGCCDHNDGIFAYNAPHNLLIQGNVIAYGESNIEVAGGSSVNVIGNFLLNPRGPNPRGQQFQCWSNCSTINVQNNYLLSSRDTVKFLHADATEDSVNFGYSQSFTVQQNFITGGRSLTGCGIIADSYANAGQILKNRLYDTGACGIGLTNGTHTVSGNSVYNRLPVKGGGNTAIYVAHYGASGTCGPMTITDNVADSLQIAGSHSGWWYPGGCGAISTITDVFGVAGDAALSARSAFTPPLIPPEPKTCVAVSPYSTQTNVPLCTP